MKKIFIFGIVISVMLAAYHPVQADSSISEYEVKAGFLFNFSKFVTWPSQNFADPKSPIRIGILGDDPFGTTLDEVVSNQSVDGHSFVVKRSQNIDELKDCHILFISSSEEGSLDKILDALKGISILTVGESEDFTRHGGMINFITSADHIKFEINVDAATRAGLTISSKMLRLAVLVKSAEGSEK